MQGTNLNRRAVGKTLHDLNEGCKFCVGNFLWHVGGVNMARFGLARHIKRFYGANSFSRHIKWRAIPSLSHGIKILGHLLEWHFEHFEAVDGDQIAGIGFGFNLARHECLDARRGVGELRDFLVRFDEDLKSSAQNFERHELPIFAGFAGGWWCFHCHE